MTCKAYSETYEDNPKHKLKRSGNVARRPTDGAAALKNAVEISGRRLLGWDSKNNELVVLMLHHIDDIQCIKYFHGYVIDNLDQLKNRQDIVSTARKAGYPLPKK
jgi:hypothetical protein